MADFLAGWHVANGFDQAVVRARTYDLLHTEAIGSFAVVLHGRPLIWTSFLAIDGPCSVSLLTSKKSEHGAALGLHTAVSMSVFRRPTVWGAPIRGVQARGVVESVGQPRSAAAYTRRFPEFSDWLRTGGTTDSSFFSIRLELIKLIDEQIFGEEIYVVMRIQ